MLAYARDQRAALSCARCFLRSRRPGVVVGGDPRHLHPAAAGGYALEWMPTFVADLYWHPPDGDAIGPMALEVTCRLKGAGTRLHVRQSGYDKDSPRWKPSGRCHDRWMEGALMKHYLEKRWARVPGHLAVQGSTSGLSWPS